jgi:hypothetical protein
MRVLVLKHLHRFVGISILLVLFWGCSVKYSFTGASISPDVKTVSIAFFQNMAPQAPPTLSSYFTEELKSRFVSQTSLNLVSDFGDLNLSGEIRNYLTAPVAIQGNETAALNRLTITVRVKFVNTKNTEQNFDKTFSHYYDFDSLEDFNRLQEELGRIIVDKLVEDIFNNSVANW